MSDKRRAAGPTYESALLENREFSYRELKHITNNFSQQVGKGGFGAVFLGYLENGNPVAVKVRSESSSQGGKEFLAEVLVIFNLEKLYVSQLFHNSYHFVYNILSKMQFVFLTHVFSV
jgi:predicted Ser/Thr protein kinase